MSEILKHEIAGRVAVLTLNRPKSRNALSPELIAELIQAIRLADAEPVVKCIQIQAEGDNFSAGGDVKGFAALMSTPQSQLYDLFERKALLANRLPQAILDAVKPVVVVTRGAVAGAGMALCLAADYVLCGKSSYFVASHVHIGLSIDCGLSSLLVGAMGIKAAKRLALLGERIDAEQALQLGMVSEVLADEDLPEAAHRLTARLAGGPAIAMAWTKRLLNDAAFGDVVRQLAREATALGSCAQTNDFAKGVEAVVSRKRAAFE